jgi:HK97 family phage portal protein
MIQWIKRLFNADKYNAASVRMLAQQGREGSHVQPFNYRKAVQLYRSWVYAAAHINATAVAASPLRLYIRSKSRTKSMWRTRSVDKGRRAYMYGDLSGDVSPSRNVMTKIMDLGDDFEEVTEMHPVIELLQKANHVYNGFDLTVLRTLYQELTGNAYLHPICDEKLGVPVELWPMPSQHVEVIPSQDNFIDGYLYGQSGVEALRFERDEVIHFKRPNPDNLFYGLGKVEAAYGTIQANVAMHEMDLATFANHARPDYAVVVKGPVRRDDLDQFEQHVGERLRGTRKAGQFLTVSGDVSFQPLNFPPKDIGGRDDIVEEIAAVFGVPVSMLKANDPNLASARAGFGQWREGTILPLLRMDEDVLNQVLLPMFGIEDDAVLCYDNPVPADKEYDLRQRQAAVAGGWQTLNEARLEQGMEQIDEPLADQLLINGLPIGQVPSPLGGLPFGPGAPALPLPQPQQAPQEQDAPKTEEDTVAPQAQVAEIDEKLALNGAQIASLVEVLQNISQGVIAREAGVEVIVATGIGREQAQQMVDSQVVSADVPAADTDGQEKALPRPDEVEGELFDTPEEAAVRAEELGGEGFHVHETTEGDMYMPFFDMDDYTEATGVAHAKAMGLEDFLEGNELAVVLNGAAATKNCGTGAGGFQPGNNCAEGDGSGGSDKPKKTPEDKDGMPLVDMNDNPVRLNDDGTITLYHGTTKENAQLIRETGRFVSRENTREAFFSTVKEGTEGYGDGTVVEVRLDPSIVRIDDAFRGKEEANISVAAKIRDIPKDAIVDSRQETKSAKNCGTGAGGFQPGNDCAAGDGSGSGDGSGGGDGDGKKEKPVELTEEQRNAISAVQPETENGQPWSTVDGKAKSEALEALSLLPEEQRNQELKKIFVGAELERGFDPFAESSDLPNDDQLQAVRVASVKQDDYLGSMANSNSNEKLRHASLTDSYIRTVKEAAQKNVALQMQDGGPLAGISEEKARAIVEASVHRTLVQAKPIDKDTRGVIDSVMSGSGREEGLDAIPEEQIYEYMGMTDFDRGADEDRRVNAEWAFMNDRRRGMIISAHETAVSEYKILENMSPTERYSHGMKRAAAAEAHFAKQGLAVKVDPRALIPVVPEKASLMIPTGDADEDLDTKQGHIQKMSAGYRELIALENARKDLEGAGFDTSSVAFSVRQRGGGPNATKNPMLAKADTFTRGWYNVDSKQITLPVDIDTVASKDKFTISGGTSRGVAIHESMHALHDQKISADVGSPLANKSLSDRALIRLGTGIIKKAAPKSGINFDTDFGQRAAIGVAGDLFSTVRASGYIDANVSKYASTEIVEYVAEVGAMSVTQPDRYKKLKSKKFNLRSMVDTLSEGKLPASDIEAIKDMTITLADIYELAGGPTE